MTVRTRFAPSPTGHVHIGNIRAAIFNWLFARHEGGQFLLRIEDTDRERSTKEACDTVLNAMAWLGLDFDEEPLYQSTRMEAHLAAAEDLLSRGLAYKEDKGGTGQGEAVIFRMPGRDAAFTDLVKGPLAKKAENMQDFVIVRSNGTPVFHLANVVDDMHMGITHVIRGDDHVENTFRHLALFEALGADLPQFGHLPMIVNAQGKPYSKRDGDAYVGDFRTQGYLAEALFNYLTLLGWSPGDDREKMSRDEIIQAFTLDRVRSAPSQMDLMKLKNLNGLYLADMDFESFNEMVMKEAADTGWQNSTSFPSVSGMMQSRTKLFTDALSWSYFFTEDAEINVPDKVIRKSLLKEGVLDRLEETAAALEGLDSFTAETTEAAVKGITDAAELGEGKLNLALRVAVTGTNTGAGLFETMELIGQKRCCQRIRDAVEKFRTV